MRKPIAIFLVTVAAAAPALALPTPADLLAKYDAIMSPVNAKMSAAMTVTRDDGSKRTYEMRFLKKGDDKTRISFDAPAAMRGQEILRLGDNSWIYLPDIKRATNMSNRDSFQGGDFSNADVLRANLAQDYTPAYAKSCDGATYCLVLTSKSKETPYQTVNLWIDAKYLPIKAQYFGTSGRLLRSASFDQPQEFFKGYTRPAHVAMVNETVKNRQSDLLITALVTDVSIPDSRFVLTDLGK